MEKGYASIYGRGAILEPSGIDSALVPNRFSIYVYTIFSIISYNYTMLEAQKINTTILETNMTKVGNSYICIHTH